MSQTRGFDGQRILVVEDMFHIAEMLEEMLRALGCEVVGPVPRLAAALRIANEAALDGAVLDVNLGTDDAEPIAEVLRRRGIPFLFVTGYDRSNEVPAAFGDVPRLKKPFMQPALAQAMRAILCPERSGLAAGGACPR